MTSEVGTNVKIKLVSTIVPTNGDKEIVEMWLQGSIVERAGITYLQYEEVLEDAVIRTTVKLTNERALIMRSGSISMRLPLNTVQRERGHYENSNGSIPIEIKTNTISYGEEGLNGKFHTNYDLIMGGSSVGNYTLEITYSEVQA